MKGKAIPFLVLAGLSVATCAFALDLRSRGASVITPEVNPGGLQLTAVVGCDDDVLNTAYYQDQNGRYGNVFTFPAGSKLTTLQFVHYGFSTLHGPYNYDLELWDPNTCTYIGGVNNLSAADAFSTVQIETENLCANNLIVSGTVAVTVDANSCFDPTDCYPDVIYDDQLFVVCPIIIDAIGGVCADVSDQSGPFLLRVEYNNCPVPTIPSSWGKVKVLYR
jgi:hypothetical protein